MQIIIISPNKATHKHWAVTAKQLATIVISILLLFIGTVFYVTQKINSEAVAVMIERYMAAEPVKIQYKPDEVNVEQMVDATAAASEISALYAKRLGDLQAEAIRLKAITKQLADLTGFDLSHFVLDKVPAQGGLESFGLVLHETDFDFELGHLSTAFDEQLQQLEAMQTYLVTEDAIESTIPSRRPINEGWMSSSYGERIDPFTGKVAFHHGIDFAGKEGSGVYAVADGFVIWSGKRGGFGQIIEIDHGNGYITRYAHSKTLLAQIGDKVSKGDKIALMGSTGHSTGPHVHFELLQAGRKINPYSFVKK